MLRLTLIAIAAAVGASSASAMPVSTFLTKADGLKAKGPLALLSGDYKLLKNEVSNSMNSLRAERLAAPKLGKRPAYCPTQQSGGMDVDEILSAMRAIPAPQRERTEVRDALRSHLARRFPCKG